MQAGEATAYMTDVVHLFPAPRAGAGVVLGRDTRERRLYSDGMGRAIAAGARGIPSGGTVPRRRAKLNNGVILVGYSKCAKTTDAATSGAARPGGRSPIPRPLPSPRVAGLARRGHCHPREKGRSQCRHDWKRGNEGRV